MVMSILLIFSECKVKNKFCNKFRKQWYLVIINDKNVNYACCV